MATKKKTCAGQIRSIVKHITVEPTAFFILVANSLASLTTQTLNLDKTCRVNLNLNETICDAVRYQNTANNTENEKLVQEYLATQLMWKSALQTALPCFLYPFVGGWLDLTGRRKLFMILPMIGDMFAYISNIINVIFFYQLPVQVLMFFDAFFPSITGGTSVILLTMYSYMVDITNGKNRTYRLGIFTFFVQAGNPTGSALSGIILKQFGYYAVYATSLTLHILNLCYVIFYLSDPPRSQEKKKYDGRGLCHGLKTFFDPNHIKNSVRVFCKKTEDNRFSRLITIVFAVCVFFGPIFGEGSILYLSTRYRFNWDAVKFSFFQIYIFIANTIGTVITVLILAKLLHWHDSILGLIACASKIAGAFVFCFATTGALFFYLGPAVDMFSNTGLTVLKSILSKQVDFDEIGKVNAVLGIFENLMPFVYVSLYTKMYTATMEVLPGAVFLLGAVLMLPAAGLFIWLFIRHKRGLEKPMLERKVHSLQEENLQELLQR